MNRVQGVTAFWLVRKIAPGGSFPHPVLEAHRVPQVMPFAEDHIRRAFALFRTTGVQPHLQVGQLVDDG